MARHLTRRGTHKGKPTQHKAWQPKRGRKVSILATLLIALGAAVPTFAYTVHRGDTLSAIARRHGTTVPRVARCNPRKIHDVNLIRVGEHLRLHCRHPHRHAHRHTARTVALSRGGDRAPLPGGGQSVAQLKAYGRALAGGQFYALDAIVTRESGWNRFARNPSSGAYGLPQALPGSKMATAGADWATNGETQLRWMVGYCRAHYGSLAGAWSFWQAHHWY